MVGLSKSLSWLLSHGAKIGFSGHHTTINAQYEINEAHNNGLHFQFDAVTRDKRQRRLMHAGDCECCREVGFFLAQLAIL